MKEFFSYFKPVLPVTLFVVLYAAALPFRPLFAPHEYDFAAAMQNFLPQISGTVLPKVPAAAATLLTGVIVWLTARKLHLVRPWITAAIYLLFPPVWYFGTSASAAPVFAFAVTATVILLFTARRSTSQIAKISCCILALPAATGAALVAKSHMFDWTCALLAFAPIAAASCGVYLEKLDDRGKAGKFFTRLGRVFTLICLTAVVLLILPVMFRHFQWGSYPQALTFYPPGTSLLRPALAFIVPLLWFFAAATADKSQDKATALAFGVGMLLFMLPAAMPWQKLAHRTPGAAVRQLTPEFAGGNVTFFADAGSAGVLKYEMRVHPRRIGRHKGDLPPSELRKEIAEALKTGDAAVALTTLEYDSFLPQEFPALKRTIGTRRIIRYYGGKK